MSEARDDLKERAAESDIWRKLAAEYLGKWIAADERAEKTEAKLGELGKLETLAEEVRRLEDATPGFKLCSVCGR